MATYNWSDVVNGTVFGGGGDNPPAFNVAADFLVFNDATISAASLSVDSPTGSETVVSYGGKTITIDVSPYSLTNSVVTFQNGSAILIGDNTTGTVNDDAANTLTGGAGNDFFVGAGGADSFSGGGGNDLFGINGDNVNGIYGNDTINGGAGGQDRVDYFDNNDLGVTVNMGNESANGSATGGDGNPASGGSTLTLIGIEAVTGTGQADTFNANSATQVNGLRGDITQRFEGLGGNDTINGATGDGRFTLIEYTHAGAGVNVNLGTGTASDGYGSTDSFNNIDGAIGSQFNDTLTGGSTSRSIGGSLFEAFEGLGGNDTINGGNGADQVRYDVSPNGVNVNLATGTASDGWGGTDTLIGIEQVRGSEFNDTLTGGTADEQFGGRGGNDTIDGGGGFDRIRFEYAIGAVSVNLGTGTAQGIGGDNGIGVDTFSNIEGARGTDFNDSLTGGGAGFGTAHLETFEGWAGNDTLNGGDVSTASMDLASYRRDPSAVIVNLGATDFVGAFTVAGGTARDGYGVNGKPAGIDTLVNINGAEGSSFNDTLLGGAGNEWFEGLAGNDSIVGGAGRDRLFYDEAPARVIVNMLGTSITVGVDTVAGGTVLDGYGTTDTIATVEDVVGSAFNDFIMGSNAANNFDGGAGNDTLVGGGSNLATGDAANDTLLGGDGNDELRQTRGADSLDGGAGNGDVLAFTNLAGQSTTGIVYGGATGVNVNLGAKTSDYDTSDGLNPIAKVINIELVHGTAGNDVLTGGSRAVSDNGTFFEAFRGGAGNDTIDGGGLGPAGSFRVGVDRVEYGDSPGAVNVNLHTGVATDGFGGTDTLINVNWVQGSAFNDTLTGGNPNFPHLERFEGMGGNDTINGGVGFDQASYQNAPGAATVNLLTGIASDGYGTTDTLTGIESVRGSNFGDTITGGNSKAIVEYFIGEGGNDTIDGGGGTDFASWQTASLSVGGVNALIANGSGTVTLAGFGTDQLTNIEGLIGTSSGDTLSGGAGDQWFRGRGGDDVINGGAGIDTADYSSDPLGVIVNLGTTDVIVGASTVAGGTAHDGWGGVYGLQGTDTLTEIENVLGSDLGDNITGSTAANRLDGGAGADVLKGGAGNDTLVWDPADTRIDGGAGGADKLEAAGKDQTIDLTTIADNKLTGIEIVNLTGTGNNTLTVNLGEVFGISNSTDTLRVDGNLGDILHMGTGWTQGDDTMIGANFYHTYTQGAPGPVATLLVDTDITALV